MTGIVRARYTLEFKQEAIRLVQGGQTVALAAKTLGVSDQTLHNWLKADAAGRLREVTGKAISAEQMELLPLSRGARVKRSTSDR
jgi:transposase